MKTGTGRMTSEQNTESKLGVYDVQRQRLEFPDARFRQNVLTADRQPGKIGLYISQFTVFRRPGLTGVGIGGLKYADIVFSLLCDHIILLKCSRQNIILFGYLGNLRGRDRH